MEWFERHCRCLASPDLVLHLGAGGGAALDAYRHLDRSRILLVEPQADLADELRRETVTMPDVGVLQLAVAGETGEASLQRFNLAGFSSLRRPTGLLELFPGLQPTIAGKVDTVTLADLMAAHGVDCAGENWIVLDAPGVEADVIDAFETSDLGRCFSHVFLHTGAEPLFEGSEPVDRLLQRFADLGYEPLGASDDSDPDLPRYHLQLNQSAIKAAALRDERIAELQSEVATRDERLARLQSDLAARDQNIVELKADLAAGAEALAESRAGARQEVAELNDVVAGVRDELTSAREASERQLADLQASLAAREQALAEAVAEKEQLARARDEQEELARARDDSLSEANRLKQRQAADLEEASSRQQLLDDELVRVEAQVDLIKDLLLRDHAL